MQYSENKGKKGETAKACPGRGQEKTPFTMDSG
jgi:hypothetical protein